VNLGHQRASGVNDLEAARLAGFAHCRRNTVSAVDDALPGRDFFNFIDEDSALLGQLIDYKAVMDDFAAHVNRRSESVEGYLYDVNGADNSGAETARLEQQDALLARGGFHVAKVGDGFSG